MAQPPRRRVQRANLALGAFTAGFVIMVSRRGGAYDLVDRQTIALLGWWVVIVGAAAGVFPRSRPSRAATLTLLSLAGLGGWSAVSLYWSMSDERTLGEVGRVLLYVGVFGGTALALPRKRVPAVVSGVAVGAVAICVLGLAYRLAPEWFSHRQDFGRTNDVIRLSYPLAYWNALGLWSAATVALLVALGCHSTSRIARAVALAPVPIVIAVGYLTYSRASIGLLAVAVVVLVALSRHRWSAGSSAALSICLGLLSVAVIHKHPEIASGTGTAGRAEILGVLVFTGLLAAAVGVLSYRLDPIKLRPTLGRALAGSSVIAALALAGILGPPAWAQFRVDRNSTTSDLSDRLTNLNGSRYELWRVALDGSADHRWRGAGAGTFEYVYNPRATTSEFVRDAHNFYLELLVELGVFGLALGLVLVASLVWLVLSTRASTASQLEAGVVAGVGAVLAALVVGLAVDWHWETPAVVGLALGLAGTLAALEGRPRTPSVGIRVAVAVIGLLACATLLPGLVGTSEVRRSESAVAADDLPVALRHADAAVAAEPWAVSPLIQRALVDERSGDVDSALLSLRYAAEREPANWRIPLLQAQLYARQGETEAALDSFETARKLRPRGRFFAPVSAPADAARTKP